MTSIDIRRQTWVGGYEQQLSAVRSLQCLVSECLVYMANQGGIQERTGDYRLQVGVSLFKSVVSKLASLTALSKSAFSGGVADTTSAGP